MSEDIIRVMRILVYEGPRNKVEDTINRSIKGKKSFGMGEIKVTVTAVTVNEFPDIINNVSVMEDKDV